MAIAPSEDDRSRLTLSRYARIAGVAMLLSIISGMDGFTTDPRNGLAYFRGIDPTRVRT